MPPTNPPPMWRLADAQVKGGIDAFIDAKRADKASWYKIALELYRVTNGKIEVTPATLRNWTLSRSDAA